MNNTLFYIGTKFGVPLLQRRYPIEIKNINRTIMAKTLGECGLKVGAEVGVAQGWHAETICQENPGVKLYCVDIWDKYEGYNEYRDRIGKYFEEAKERLKTFDTVIVQKFSMDAVKDFADNSLDFVYIDAAHDLKNGIMDITEWAKKVRPGGIVFGHDYKRRRIGESKYPVGIKDAVQAYCNYHLIEPWFELKNDIRDPKFGPDNPGWMFVRQEKDLI